MTSLDSYLAAAATAALATLPGGTYLRESQAQAGLDVNTQPAPFIILSDYTTATPRADSKVSSAQLTLYFGDVRPGQGDDPAAHAAAVLRMEQLKRAFLAALDSRPLAQLDAIRATPFETAYAAELDGIGCQFTLTVPAVALC